MAEAAPKHGLLGRAWHVWRSLIEREDAVWRSRTGETSDASESKSDDGACSTAAKAPSLADLVNERRSELKHDR